ncbi:MAG: hypothetical protein INR69_18690 [Mucilaginibacter polytrichastri]|nr:hypothetical protein [Mucilaginibacter polytrichastri]
MESQFKKGDIVRLAIDGPRLLVTGVEEDGRVKCFWFNKYHQPHTEIFDAELLIPAPPEGRSAGFYSS